MRKMREARGVVMGVRWVLAAAMALVLAGGVSAEDDIRRQQIIEYVQANPNSAVAQAVREANGAPARSATPAPQNGEAADAQANGNADAAAAAAMPRVGWLELSGELREGPVPFAWVSESEADPSLADVVLFLDQPELTMTQVATIGQAMQRVRDAGKRVMTFSVSYDLLSYMLASHADEILLQHRGSVELSGLALEEIYVAGLLEKIGVKADLVQIGEFKGAQDPITRTGPSDAWSRNMDALLDELYGQIVRRIGEGRRMTANEVEAMLRDVWTMSDGDYVRRRVVDRLTDRDLIDVTEIAFGDRFEWDERMGRGRGDRGRQADNPFAILQQLFQDRQPRRVRRPSIAVIHASGPVVSGDSTLGGGLFSSDSIGSRTMVKVLGEVRDDPQIRGAIIRIDSPGGSALASEVIWQAVRDLGEHKPTYSSIDTMAASGGYYIASATDQIYVSEQSIVGSIGVVGGKIVLGGLYEKLGIGVHRRTRGPMADMLNSVEPFTESQRAALTQAMVRTYDQFIDRVKIGRGRRIADVEQVAAGRIFTGSQAVNNGLADRTGGVNEAILAMAAQLNLQEGQYDVVHLPGPMSLGEFIGSLFGTRSPAAGAEMPAVVGMARQVLGRERWHATSRLLTGIMLLQHEPTLTLMPHAIILK